MVRKPLSKSYPPVEEGTRKRVTKACDRCRLKKTKCNGSSPCERCKIDNAICVFRLRTRPTRKVHSQEYVELLEYEQTQLVAGLRELYHRLRSMEGLKTNPLGNEPHGSSLIHEILEELGILRQDGQSEINENYEGSDTTQNIFEAEFTYATGRKEPLHTGSDGDRSPVFEPVDFHEPDDPLNLSVAQHCSTTLVEMPYSSSIHTSFLHEPKVSSQPTSRPSQAAWQLGISRLSAMEFESPLSEEISLPDMMASEAELVQSHAGMLVDPCLMMTEC